MTFSEALQEAKTGKSIQRDGWDNKRIVKIQYPNDENNASFPCFYIEKEDNIKCFWLPTQKDLFATDWICF